MASSLDFVEFNDASGGLPSDILTGSREQFQNRDVAAAKRALSDNMPRTIRLVRQIRLARTVDATLAWSLLKQILKTIRWWCQEKSNRMPLLKG
jgi:hypothetical protein